MNCKPNDLARIVRPSKYGTLVEVLYATPMRENYTLPDGNPAMRLDGDNSSQWVCKALGAPFDVPVYPAGQCASRFASIEDRWLRPIRDKDGDDETLTWAGKPAPVETMAPKPQREFAR